MMMMLRKSHASTRAVREMSTKVGFIGLGQMGEKMALNLQKAGHSLVVFDVQNSNTKQVAKAGAQVADSPKDVAVQSDVLITMLPSTPHVQQVYQGENGVLAGVSTGMTLIDSSTIEPFFSKEVAKQADAKGAFMVDAPVSGGVNGAAAGTLTFMVGGSQEAFDRSKPFLEKMGKNIVHCGDISTGQAAKLCNNLALAIEMIAVSEAMLLGNKLGIDAKVLAGIMNTSSSQCWSSSTYNPHPDVLPNVPSSNNYEGGFASVLMRKDLGLALDAAKSVEASVPFTASAHQLYNILVSQGKGKKDFSAIYQLLKGNTK